MGASMPRPDGRPLLGLLGPGALSFLAGLFFVQLIERVPCHDARLQYRPGDRRLCRHHLGHSRPAVFGLTLSIARNRPALLGAGIVLLVPPVAFFVIGQIEHTLYLGFEPQRQIRSLLVTFAPPALTVLTQYLVLRLVVPPALEASP
jgi:hypothetical protein